LTLYNIFSFSGVGFILFFIYNSYSFSFSVEPKNNPENKMYPAFNIFFDNILSNQKMSQKAVECHCHDGPALKLQVKKEGPNQGIFIIINLI
jgi:hypothetical protein